MRDGAIDIEDNYSDEYSKLLIFHKVKPTDEKMKNMPLEHQEIYLRILFCGLLDN